MVWSNHTISKKQALMGMKGFCTIFFEQNFGQENFGLFKFPGQLKNKNWLQLIFSIPNFC